jgi:glyoxylase-like metal-dependent hydrolase (beta-lactamase superfamily II)
MDWRIMQEITSDIFIETSYLGVTLGAINTPHGLVLIDAPLKAEDIRIWRSALLNQGGGVDRLLINLDAHPDRTLGSRLMEYPVVGHEKIAQAFRNRPTTFKSQNSETGADWEYVTSLGTIRWNPPEISFSTRMQIHWGTHPILLDHRPGSSSGAIWVNIPDEKVVFVGDAVMKNQPPFLTQADLPVWIASLKELLSPEFREYFFVSGRGGLVSYEDVHRQIKYLEDLQPILSAPVDHKNITDGLDKLIPELLAPFDFPQENLLQYSQRLRWGITHYRMRETHPNTPDPEE